MNLPPDSRLVHWGASPKPWRKSSLGNRHLIYHTFSGNQQKDGRIHHLKMYFLYLHIYIPYRIPLGRLYIVPTFGSHMDPHMGIYKICQPYASLPEQVNSNLQPPPTNVAPPPQKGLINGNQWLWRGVGSLTSHAFLRKCLNFRSWDPTSLNLRSLVSIAWALRVSRSLMNVTLEMGRIVRIRQTYVLA